MYRLTEAIQIIVLGQRTRKFNKLVLKDQFRTFCREKSVTCRNPEDREGEGRLIGPYQAKIARQ